jgi:two-component system, cell cycle sensor histidine kinase and response regulator CckA
MKKFFDRLLYQYDKSDWLLQRKARTFLILQISIFFVLVIEIFASSHVLGRLDPQFFTNLSIAVGVALSLIPLLRGSYHVAVGVGIIITLAGISWTRYIGTGYFSSDASYDVIQYVLDLIVTLFYVNLIAVRKRHIVLALICSLLLFSGYMIALPAIFQSLVLPAMKSVFISGYIFLVLSGLIILFSFQQNQRAVEIAKQEADASSRSEQKYTEIFNSTNEAIFILDASSMHIVDVNDAMLKMYGYETKEQLLSMDTKLLVDHVPPFSFQNFLESLHHTSEIGPQTFEWLASKKSGESFWVEISLRSSEISGQKRILAVVRDIAERKGTEEALRRTEILHRLITENAADVIWAYSFKTEAFTYVSDSVQKLRGYTPEEVMHQTIGEAISPKSLASVIQSMLKSLQERKPGDTSFMVTKHLVDQPCKNGSVVSTEVMSTIVFDDEGRPDEIIGISRDITERKRAEEKLLTIEFSMNQASDAIFWMNRDAGFFYVNGQACHLLGYGRDELLTLHLWDIDPVFTREQWEADWSISQKDVGTGQHRLETLHRRKDGTVFPVEVTWNYICFGETEMHVVLVRDISERKRAEKALQESEELYRKLITTVPDVIIRTDLEGNILFVKEAEFQSFGYSGNERIMGKNILSFVTEHDRGRAEENMQIMVEQYLGPQEYILIGHEGLQIDCEINGDILRHNDGTPFGMVFFIRDLTEKKRMQAQLIQSQKMEAVGRLAGGVAHDYNNMLGVILGYASMIEKELPSVHPAQSKIKSIISAAERSANLTKQLLAFARQQIIAPVVVNLNDELTSLQKMLGRLIGEDIRLVLHTEGKLWNIKIDPTQLTQVFTNLATNARDAIENVGTITIGTANVFIDEAKASEQDDIPPGEFVMVSFSDSGAGMDNKIQAHIFEPFFTTKPIGQGTGLGLATVFGVVKQNNGFINVSSDPGHGTSFKIYFPRFIGESDQVDEDRDEQFLKGKETILIVEDEEELLYLTKVTLEAHGYNVLSALSPSEACTLCEKYTAPIDILVTDVVMPGMNGKELKEWMEKKYKTIKTLFVSGYTSDIVAKRGVLEEGMHFLQKPFTRLALLKKVKELLQSGEDHA